MFKVKHAEQISGRIKLAIQFGLFCVFGFISLIGCNDTRIINEDELVSIKYAKGEKNPFSGTVITRYDDGKLMANAKYEYGVRNGPFTIYFKNGNVHIESSHLNSEFHGDYIKYYENGAVQSTGELINGNKQGMWDWNSEDGKDHTRSNYVNDLQHGSHLYWNEDGSKELSQFKEGQLTGPFKKWFPNGNLQEESNWINWKANGPFTYYDQDGKIIFKGEHKDDKIDWVEAF